MALLGDRVIAHLRDVANERGEADTGGEPTDVHRIAPLSSVARRFDLGERLGEGGMGVVYRARDRTTGRLVALKILHQGDASAEQRFDREIRALAALAHAGIVGYVAHGGAAGGDPPFVAMELLEGEDLSARLARGPLGVAEAIHIGVHVASALAAAHAVGLVHRDVKPGNVFLCKGGAIKLVDFGLARPLRDEAPITRDGYAAGTLGYMAPEQLRGERDVDARADVFALGCVLHDGLAGRRRRRLLQDLLAPPPPLRQERADVPEALEAVLLDMLAPSAASRLPDCGAVRARLAALQRFERFEVLVSPSARGARPHVSAPRSFGRWARLVGREEERAWLERGVATPGFGCLIVGDAGVGKTRLALDVVDDGWTIVGADPSRDAEPLAFLSRLVGALSGVAPGDRGADRRDKAIAAVLQTLPDAAAADALGRLAWCPAATSPAACVAAWTAWAASVSARAPWRLVLDDLDGADAESLAALGETLTTSGARRPTVVALARPAILARHPGIAARLGLVAVSLRGLAPEALDALAEEVSGPGGASLLGGSRALGSPLFAEETLRGRELGLSAPSPDTLEARVAAKIAALGPYARWALRAAIHFAGPFDEADLEAVLGQRDPAATRRALVELALFDLVVPLAGQPGAFRVQQRVDAEVARALTSPYDASLGARVVAELLETVPRGGSVARLAR